MSEYIVIYTAILSRLAVLILGVVSLHVHIPYLQSSTIAFDTSAHIDPCQNITSYLDTPLECAFKLMASAFYRWDALHFVNIARHGYGFEKSFAFFPALPMTLRLFGIDDELTTIVTGLIVTNICFVLAALSLYRLSLRVLKDPKIATISALLFCIGPGGPFMSSIYTESPFAMLSFGGMLAFSNQKPIVASVLWGMAATFRSNGVLLSGFLLYGLLLDFRTRKLALTKVLTSLIGITIVVSSMAASQYCGYRAFCQDVDADSLPPWCNNTLPMIYSFVQQKYWDVGLFKYYKPSQIPNFIVAAPILAMTIHAAWIYASSNPDTFWSLGLVLSRTGYGFSSSPVLPYLYLWLAQALVCGLMLHVQIMGRFLSSMPALYWYVAHVFVNGQSKSQRIMVEYLLLYLVVGTLLFCNFLPPA
ncbi:hypothetical protein SmJEL517_g03847 [Synchytrium microbalum]|uniref:GPI mannosyltransferase 2 n=1 Tax=Synchytrium microbalum TaxID=1806994 RepID=A0A507BUZ3_9FUNG|nr:uncharacterized protein SmJEL517_g03847 [Synchytrium microbalum]TPX33250.1 hypothetical protein SmJEL517_g03847 [Synchytrium microbalum]